MDEQPHRGSERTATAPWMEKNRLIRVGHRGVGARFEPPNTLRAYRRALQVGVEMIEVDLRQTNDGTLVLAHDEAIHAEDGPHFAISDHSLARLREVDLGEGERIPTLEEALELCRGRCALMLDLKGEGFEKDLVDLLHRADFKDVVIPGGGETSRARIRDLDSTLPLSRSLGHEARSSLNDGLFDSLDTAAVTWHFTLLDEATVSRLHERGLKVFAWTVNTEEEMSRLVSLGVDGIISDRIDFLSQLK